MYFDELLRILTVIVLGASFYLGFLNFNFLRKNTERVTLANSITNFNLHRKELEILLALEGVPYEKWTNEQKTAANVICFDLFHLGHLINNGYIPQDFCELYYYTIPKAREIADPYIREVRMNRHEQYWRKFDDLVLRTMEYTKNHKDGLYHIQCSAKLLSGELCNYRTTA